MVWCKKTQEMPMSEPQETMLEFYSLGIVTEDKERNSDLLKVCPIEVLPMIDGELGGAEKTMTHQYPDSQNVQKSSNTSRGVELVAKWLPLGQSNRITPPDCIKNETVAIYKYADADEYFWNTIFNEPKIRQLETVLNLYGGEPKALTENTKSNSYWIEVSTHDKYIKIHTSRNNGEPYAYDIELNTGVGFLEIKDDVGNSLKLDSKEGIFSIITNKKVEIKTKDFVINGDSLFHDNVHVNKNVDVDQKVQANQGIKASHGTGSTSGLEVDGDVTIKKDLKVNQNLNVVGNITAGGSIRSPDCCS